MITFLNRKRPASTPISELRYASLSSGGWMAEDLHRFIKQAKKQGVKVSGSYKYDSGERRLHALNITLTGPDDVIDALDLVINGLIRMTERRAVRRGW